MQHETGQRVRPNGVVVSTSELRPAKSGRRPATLLTLNAGGGVHYRTTSTAPWAAHTSVGRALSITGRVASEEVDGHGNRVFTLERARLTGEFPNRRAPSEVARMTRAQVRALSAMAGYEVATRTSEAHPARHLAVFEQVGPTEPSRLARLSGNLSDHVDGLWLHLSAPRVLVVDDGRVFWYWPGVLVLD